MTFYDDPFSTLLFPLRTSPKPPSEYPWHARTLASSIRWSEPVRRKALVPGGSHVASDAHQDRGRMPRYACVRILLGALLHLWEGHFSMCSTAYLFRASLPDIGRYTLPPPPYSGRASDFGFRRR